MMLSERLKDYKKHIPTVFGIIVISVYVILTAKAAFLSGRLGWEDEAHFWVMVKNCSIPQLFSLMKVEGHMLLWYLLVMPFAKIGLPYPYPMQILNWLFCTGAVLIMWKKSNFHPLIKMGIVFSPVLFQLFSVHARCYSIGVFFLFAACALYGTRLKRPYLYFLVLLLAANTSVQGLIGATALGIIFLYDLVKDCIDNKKSFKVPATVSVLTLLMGIILFFQFMDFAVPDYETVKDTAIVNPINYMNMFLGIDEIQYNHVLLWKIIGCRVFLFVITLIFATRFRAFFVYFFTFSMSAMFFMNFYSPRVWHLAFYFIYFIIAYWIYLEEKPDKKNNNIAIFLIYFFLACLLSVRIYPPNPLDIYTSVIKYNKLEKGKIFTDIYPIAISVALPKMNERNMTVYDLNGRDLSKYEALKVIFSASDKEYEGKNIYKYTDNNKPNYLLSFEPQESSEKFKDINLKVIEVAFIYGVRIFVYEILPPNDIAKSYKNIELGKKRLKKDKI